MVTCVSWVAVLVLAVEMGTVGTAVVMVTMAAEVVVVRFVAVVAVLTMEAADFVVTVAAAFVVVKLVAGVVMVTLVAVILPRLEHSAAYTVAARHRSETRRHFQCRPNRNPHVARPETRKF
jgi:predicted DCC family thiol-disulfide oxidoreductase YuxK